MTTAKVTSKGQITIPKRVRDRLGVKNGDSIAFEEKAGRFVIRKAAAASPFGKWSGRLAHLTGKSSDDIVRAARGHDRSR